MATDYTKLLLILQTRPKIEAAIVSTDTNSYDNAILHFSIAGIIFVFIHSPVLVLLNLLPAPTSEGNITMIDEIDDMIIEILRSYPGTWPVDITDRVFLAIEQDQNKQKRYETYADGDNGTANSQIGAFVRDYTGLTAVGENHHPKSKLIKGYSLLAQVGKK